MDDTVFFPGFRVHVFVYSSSFFDRISIGAMPLFDAQPPQRHSITAIS